MLLLLLSSGIFLDGFLSFADNFAISGKIHCFFSPVKRRMSNKHRDKAEKWLVNK
jgi:hypothetical protein